jgi:branched-subunit amino acid transport protein AzlD
MCILMVPYCFEKKKKADAIKFCFFIIAFENVVYIYLLLKNILYSIGVETLNVLDLNWFL